MEKIPTSNLSAEATIGESVFFEKLKQVVQRAETIKQTIKAKIKQRYSHPDQQVFVSDKLGFLALREFGYYLSISGPYNSNQSSFLIHANSGHATGIELNDIDKVWEFSFNGLTLRGQVSDPIPEPLEDVIEGVDLDDVDDPNWAKNIIKAMEKATTFDDSPEAIQRIREKLHPNLADFTGEEALKQLNQLLDNIESAVRA